MGMESKFVWMDGKLVDFEKATLHFLTPALHYGAGVFEGIRCYETEKGRAIFRLREHIERLFDSAKIFGFREFHYTVDQVMQGCKDVVKENGFKECYIRPLLFLTGGGWNLSVDAGRDTIGIAAWQWDNYLGEEALSKGIRANISSFTRHHVNVTMTKSKVAGNYANSFLAKTESLRLGFDEAIMLDPQGFVGECTGENLFIVKSGKIITPATASVLEGITRHSLIAIANDLDYEVLQLPISRDQLYSADEVFVSGTAAECIGLSEIDFRKIGAGTTGPVTKAIQKVYSDAIHGKDKRYEAWLEYMD